LLQGFGNLGVSPCERLVLLLQLREQSDVLDGNNGLVGEGLDQRDVFIREPGDFPAIDGQAAEQRVALHQRDTENGSHSFEFDRRTDERVTVKVGDGRSVLDVCGSPRPVGPEQWWRHALGTATKPRPILRARAVECDSSEEVGAFVQPEHCELGGAEPSGAGQNRVEHGTNIAW